MVKFGRNYQLDIETQYDGTLTIKPPFTVEFDVVRNNLASVNNGQIRIYNLNTNTRSLIRHDRNDFGNVRRVRLKAGYGSNLSTVFDGTITYAWSNREGSNMITQIQGFDNGDGYVNGKFNGQFSSNVPTSTILETIAESIPSVTVGVIGDYDGTNTRGKSYSGSPMGLLDELTGGGAFIDNSVVHCLQDEECLEGQLSLINSGSGLLGTPIREERVLTFDMIFEPRLIVGQIVQLDSSTAANFNGFYKIVGLKHRAVISPVICGEAVTSVNLWYGLGQLKVVS